MQPGKRQEFLLTDCGLEDSLSSSVPANVRSEWFTLRLIHPLEAGH
jgi:hypothetical protein